MGEENNSLSIKSWSEEDRPREKLYQKGAVNLTNAELLAILLRTGTQKESAVAVSQRILASVNDNLGQLGKLTIEDFTKNFKGVGEAKAVTISASLELGRRRKLSEALKRETIKKSKDAADIMTPLLEDIPHEEFWVLILNQGNKVLEKFKVSQGGLSGTVTDVRVILKRAINQYASALILIHNHPSGTQKPSEADQKLTQKLKEAAKWMDIRLLDHLIIFDGGFYSFADEDVL